METLHYRGDIAPNGDLEPFRVAARDKVSPEAVRLLTQRPMIEVTDDKVRAQAAIIRDKTKLLTPDDFNGFPELMMVIRAGVGIDNVKMDLAANRGIATVNTPGGSTNAVATRVLAFVLSWAARIREGTSTLHAGQWAKGQQEVKPIDLTEKTMGIIGYGRIGRRSHELVAPHVRRVLFTDIRPIEGVTDLPTLLRESDIVSVNVDGKKELLTPELFALMKPTALLVNTARGPVVNPQALLAHLDQGGSAALDVFPVDKESQTMFDQEIIQAITQHPNFLGTPHTAGSDPVSQRKLGVEAAHRAIEFAEEGTVNPGGLPGHTLPRVSLQKKPEADDDNGGNGNGTLDLPRIRLVITHPSVPDILYNIDGAIHQVGETRGQMINIIGADNQQGKIIAVDGAPLAMTQKDLQLTADQRDVALQVMHEIRRRIAPLKERLFLIA